MPRPLSLPPFPANSRRSRCFRGSPFSSEAAALIKFHRKYVTYTHIRPNTYPPTLTHPNTYPPAHRDPSLRYTVTTTPDRCCRPSVCSIVYGLLILLLDDNQIEQHPNQHNIATSAISRENSGEP